MPLHFNLEKHFDRKKSTQFFIRSKPESIISEEQFLDLTKRTIRIKYSAPKELLKFLQAETKVRKTSFSIRRLPY